MKTHFIDISIFSCWDNWKTCPGVCIFSNVRAAQWQT